VRAVTAEEARRLDAETIAAGTPGIVLMERAASRVAQEILDLVGRRPRLGGEVVVLAGAGNNGGDGFEVARLLGASVSCGRVTVLLVGDPDRLPPDAATTFGRLGAAGIPVHRVRCPGDLEPLSRATLSVDALLGTGLSRPISPGSLEADAVERVSLAPYVVAVDLPSGLAGGRPDLPGPHVRADLTVTFGRPKIAHVRLPAAGACGRIVVAPIGLLGEAGSSVGSGPEVVSAGDAFRILPPRTPDGHKGTYGTVGIIGGQIGMAGAPALAARAAFRCGAGKVVVKAPDAVRPIVHALCPEATTISLGAVFGQVEALAVGPGLGTSGEAAEALREAAASPRPAVFDADALNLAAGVPEVFQRDAPTVLTPHPGEAARLLRVSTEAVGRDRVGAAVDLARRARSVVVLKGFRSVIASADGEVAIVLAGNPGMATGGAGDVLTGVIAALLARGLGARDAAAVGAFLHGLAGDLGRERMGEESLVAGDLVEFLPEAFLAVRWGGGGWPRHGERPGE
jgi:NAD(P)H-hydrate epimerase